MSDQPTLAECRDRVEVLRRREGDEHPRTLAAILWQFGERGEAYWLQRQLVETRRRAQPDDPATRAAIAVLEAMHKDGMP